MFSGRQSPFNEMMTAGERLIEAQRLENTISKLYSKHPTEQRLEQWKTARKLVEELGEEYLNAIRHYRESVEPILADSQARTIQNELPPENQGYESS